MKFANKLLIFAFCLVLLGCQTGYEPIGFKGGYEEIKLNENTYQITAHGNGYTSHSRTQQIALMRAADLTIQNGFDRFEIVNSSRDSRVYGGGSSINFVGNTAIVNNHGPIVKPESGLIIRFVPKNSVSYSNALDARSIMESLRGKL